MSCSTFSIVPDYFDARPFQSLKILELGMQCGNPSTLSREALLHFLWISDTLKTLPDDTLIEAITLTLDLDISLSPRLPDIPWDAIDNPFSPQERAKGRFRHLKRATLLACGHLPMEDVENPHPQVHLAHTLRIQEVKNHLQYLSLLGVLEIQFISFESRSMLVSSTSNNVYPRRLTWEPFFSKKYFPSIVIQVWLWNLLNFLHILELKWQ